MSTLIEIGTEEHAAKIEAWLRSKGYAAVLYAVGKREYGHWRIITSATREQCVKMPKALRMGTIRQEVKDGE